VSYGTRVAQHFMRRYPTHTRRVILDGVADPGLALGPGIAIDSQRALDALFARCTENSDCAARFDDPAATFRALLQRLDTEPATTLIPDPNTGRPIEDSIGAAELGFAVRLLSYSATTAALIPLVIDEAANHDNFAPLAAQVAMVERSLGGMLAIGMHNAVVCTEDTPFVELDDAELAAIDATYLGRANVDGFETICELWPAGVLDDDLREPLASDIPTLLLSGENDPVTPPANATRAASELSQSQHIVGPAQGHGLIGLGCVPRLAATFVSAEAALPLDASCVDELAAMPFFIDFAGPAR
jgi:pimeloyl-ACP methyl ester carboxylesterase